MSLQDHPLRLELTNEMHARPSMAITAPAQVGYLVLKSPQNAVSRPAGQDHMALQIVTDHYGLPVPDPRASHYRGALPMAELKWERHTEVATYTLQRAGRQETGFDPAIFSALPVSWGRNVDQSRLTMALIDVRPWAPEGDIKAYLAAHFDADSLVASYVLDEAALVAGDFRIDGAGYMRFAVFVKPETGANRVGRIVQRICEIETYRALSMLGLAKARAISKPLVEADSRLTGLLADLEDQSAETTLTGLLDTAAEIERHASLVTFRFSATEAYETIVHQRISVLRETRFHGRQTLSEFMMRRFDPAMRTVQSTARKLTRMSDRAANAADLLRTRVDVERSAQSQKLLESMDRRADTQLQLQKTVEGLSVVAIGYYAVSLAGYFLAPFEAWLGIEKPTLNALVAVPILLVVWWIIRSIRARHL